MWGLWLLRHSLGREPGAGWWPRRRRRAEGKRSGGVSVSMVLTSRAHRRRTPEKSRRISTISAGNIDAGSVDVSAVDTRPRRSESEVLAAQPGAPITGPSPLPPPTRRLRRVPVVMVGRRPRFESRLESARAGLLHEGRDLLAKGCAYCTKAPPTQSAPDPPPLAPHPRAVRPDDARRHHSDRVSPLQQAEAAALPSDRPTPPVS